MKALTDKIIEGLIEEKNTYLYLEQYCDGITYAIEMIQKLEKEAEFDEVARVVMKHLSNPEKYHPHHRVVIDSTNAELLEGKQSTGQVMDYISD